MLFRRETLDGIAKGKVTLAFRRWKRPTVKADGRVRTAAGVVRIGKIEICGIKDLNESDAAAAGLPSLEALNAMLGPDNGDPVYRILIDGIEPDARVELRGDAQPNDSEWADIRARFAKWEKSAPGYFTAILTTIGEKPSVAAAELAASFDTEKLKFKQDVRKLKELGLTESLDVGYRLSPRGETVLKWLLRSQAA